MYSFIPKNKFEKLVHPSWFYFKKFITMHGHINVKFNTTLFDTCIHKCDPESLKNYVALLGVDVGQLEML